ncbi:DNA sulfur modification protein DndB [Clostridium sp.]|uniref:DNA sulfur modification protein DndB n=1 Tax=Clostridium sp. TaxID=1506 RepID=UPI002631DE68|nr:DNA sulfur modification protein DndB [Clostridium sp.]
MDRKKREKLEGELLRYFNVILNNNEMKENIKNYYVAKNINSSVPMRIINKDTIFELLTDVDLCMLVSAINTTPNDFGLDVNKYFNEADIELANEYKKTKLEKSNVIEFHNVDQTNEKIWCCSKITFDEIVELSSEKKIGYNFNTQREGKVILKGNDMVKIPTINPKAVNEIIESWQLGTYVPDMITLNAENPLDIEYNPNTRVLRITLDDDDYLATVDGQHRTSSAIKIKQLNPSFKRGFYYLRITNFTEEEAQQFIIQADKHTPINAEHLKLMDAQDISSKLAKYIDEYGNPKTNLLFNKFAIKNKELELDKICLFSTISYPIKYYFDANSMDKRESDILRNALIRGFEAITLELSKDFKNVNKSRQTNVSTMNGTFVLYVAIINELYKLKHHQQTSAADERKLEDNLIKIINKIDFTFNNPIWQDLDIIDDKNSMIVKKIGIKDCNKISKFANEIIFNNDNVNDNNLSEV